MPARILILDTVPTNRIVLKAKMLAAQFAVDACEDLATAKQAIETNQPDLILVNMAENTDEERAFCTTLRNAHETTGIAVIALGVPDTSQARFAALDAGADDVMPRPLNDTLLLARIRSLLRIRCTRQEFALREGTTRALGFDEPRSPFAALANVVFISPQPDTHAALIDGLTKDLNHPVTSTNPDAALTMPDIKPLPDLLLVDATEPCTGANTPFSLVADLRSRDGTRLATQLVLVGPNRPQDAAMFLDLGADDVVSGDCGPAELALRTKALIRRKHQQDQLRNTVRDGLHAAVTDPLTGLYNRRYVAPYLTRIAEEAQTTGRGFAVMMLDIDHFKAVNDTYGHTAGDTVLIALADRLRENLRAIDLVARMGGEEFLVAMPRTSLRRAQLAADRLRRVVSNRPFEIGDCHGAIEVSVSVGVAVSDPERCTDAPYTQLCDSADKALYAAKAGGRNQVSISSSAA